MRNLLTIFIFIAFGSMASAQSTFTLLHQKEGVSCYYKIKPLKSDQNRIVIKFKNQTKFAQNLNLELGLYLNGVLEETTQLAACQGKGFFKQLFTTKYAILQEVIEEKQLLSNGFKLEVIDFKASKTEQCEKPHS